jgi:hypothetical protein
MSDASCSVPQAPEPARARPPRRWLTALVVFLLIAIPATYLVVSAVQSQAGGAGAERAAADTSLSTGWPSPVQRRIYDVPVPSGSWGVAFYETNAWHDSSLYVQFTTSATNLDVFLEQIGTDRATLKQGDVTIDAEKAGSVGWRFPTGGDWWGLVKQEKRPQPKVRITVNFLDSQHPRVYVVSTITP